jgi:hypothetical protein
LATAALSLSSISFDAHSLDGKLVGLVVIAVSCVCEIPLTLGCSIAAP